MYSNSITTHCLRIAGLRITACTLFLFGALALGPVPAFAADEADDAQMRFDEAMAALDSERVYTARRLLKELLVDYPTLYRARLELARADYLARDFAAAEAEVQRVLEDPEVPPSVRTTLLAFLAQIRDDKQSFEKKNRWSGQVYAGLMYDSNVNFGVERDIIDTATGTIFVLPESRDRSDSAAVLDAGLLHTYNSGRTFESGERTGYFLWQTQGNAYYRAYFDETDFNFGVLTLRTGPAWVVPNAWRASIGLQADQLFLGSDNLALFTTLNPNISWQTSEVTEISVGASATERSYKEDNNKERDGRQYRGSVTVAHVINKERNRGVQAGIAYAGFDAKNDRFSYKSPEVFVGIASNTWERGSAYARIGYRRFEFEGAEPLPLNSSPRDDDEWRLVLGARHELDGGFLPGWSVRAEAVYTDNASSNPLFEYDRYQLSLGLQKTF
jgi:hypothetical protein